MSDAMVKRFHAAISEISEWETRVALLSIADPHKRLPEAREKLLAAVYALTTGDDDPSLADEVEEALTDREAEVARLRSTLEEVDWRTDMENAPRDGTEVLVWGPNQDRAYFACFDDGWRVPDVFPYAWTDLLYDPTHWMPLPTPPEGETP